MNAIATVDDLTSAIKDKKININHFLCQTQPALLWQKDSSGQLPLNYAIYLKHPRKIIQIMLDCALDENMKNSSTKLLDLQDADGMTALHFAAARGMPEIVNELLKRNASLAIKCYRGLSPFVIAVQYGHIKVIQLFNEQLRIDYQVQAEQISKANKSSALTKLSIVNSFVEKQQDAKLSSLAMTTKLQYF